MLAGMVILRVRDICLVSGFIDTRDAPEQSDRLETTGADRMHSQH